ncbi:hypothetical protein HHK36_026018 [Tetracentron sinense]|uniref:Diacylglycerol kinase accessory domain-containing protein n=1 Tax=Tetracentron sinense TaxID=13715 RepID=A0A834YHZ1_TETSI|nr:hypothetical protein HHK36_026018 [Tetracentron sinense]
MQPLNPSINGGYPCPCLAACCFQSHWPAFSFSDLLTLQINNIVENSIGGDCRVEVDMARRTSPTSIEQFKPDQIVASFCVRAIVALNLHNYGSGRNPWGKLKPDYLEKKGFVEAYADDGLLEIFGLKQGWHASFVMVELISAKHIAQVHQKGTVSGEPFSEIKVQKSIHGTKCGFSKPALQGNGGSEVPLAMRAIK